MPRVQPTKELAAIVIRQPSTTPLLSAARLQELGDAVVVDPRALLTAAATPGIHIAIGALVQMLGERQGGGSLRPSGLFRRTR